LAARKRIHEIFEDVDFNGKFRRAESGWWIAYCEEVPEARTQGETIEEARENLRDAIGFILEDFTDEELEELKESIVSVRSETLAL
jgi:predicted RNase H-like HicB family nuclease